MKYIEKTTEFYIEENTVISLGKFDGIHRGHELLLAHLHAKKEEGLSTVIFTFDIPPQNNTNHTETKVLTTNKEKKHMFEQFQIDYLVECPFTEEIMCMTPEKFIEKIIRQLHVKCIVVGEDFCFGHNRIGDYHLLQKFSEQYGYEVVVVKKMKENNRDISSTFVREEVALGNIEKANQLLGYRYFVTGVVRHGNKIGRTIGIPTINLIPPKEKLLPQNGVYISEVLIGERKYCGITNVGCKPTIDGENPVGVETHLLDFHDDVYEKIVTVEFIKKIRNECKFNSLELLCEQLQKDILEARKYFS